MLCYNESNEKIDVIYFDSTAGTSSTSILLLFFVVLL